MHLASRVTKISALALGIAGALTFGQAQATGFQIRENSVKNFGRANAGTTVAKDDASVATNNPAAMVNLDSTTVRADVTVIDLSAEFSGGGVAAAGSPLQSPLSGGDGGDPGDPTAVPALAVVVPMKGALEGLTLGASLSAPYGLKTEYDRDWVGRYNAVESDLKTIDLTLSAAVALTERFSVGVGFIYQRAEATLSNAVDFGSAVCRVNVALCVTPTPATAAFGPQKNDGFAKVTGDDNGIGWIAGVQWKPTDRLSLGYAHRSEIDHELEGKIEFDKPAQIEALFGAAGITSYNTGPGGAKLTTPSTDTVSVQYDFTDSFRMMADYQRTDWHSLDAINIVRANGTPVTSEPFEWKDTDMFALGAEFDLSDAFTLRGGIAYDETPTKTETRTPRLPDNDRNLYTLGLTWNASEALSIDAAYMRIQIDDSKVNAVSSSGSLLTGKFSGNANLFGVSAQYKF